MADKASMDTKWKVLGGIIIAILGFAIWYYQVHHDRSDGHHGQPENDELQSIEETRPNSR